VAKGWTILKAAIDETRRSLGARCVQGIHTARQKHQSLIPLGWADGFVGHYDINFAPAPRGVTERASAQAATVAYGSRKAQLPSLILKLGVFFRRH
jgi:hypothetical protein